MDADLALLCQGNSLEAAGQVHALSGQSTDPEAVLECQPGLIGQAAQFRWPSLVQGTDVAASRRRLCFVKGAARPGNSSTLRAFYPMWMHKTGMPKLRWWQNRLLVHARDRAVDCHRDCDNPFNVIFDKVVFDDPISQFAVLALLVCGHFTRTTHNS